MAIDGIEHAAQLWDRPVRVRKFIAKVALETL